MELKNELSPEDEPKATFCNKDNADVYAYCNLHDFGNPVYSNIIKALSFLR